MSINTSGCECNWTYTNGDWQTSETCDQGLYEGYHPKKPDFAGSEGDTKKAPCSNMGGGPGGVGEAADEATQYAVRLARAIVSQIALTAPDRFAEAVESRELAALGPALGPGRDLFTNYVDSGLGEPDAFLHGALVHIAEERS